MAKLIFNKSALPAIILEKDTGLEYKEKLNSLIERNITNLDTDVKSIGAYAFSGCSNLSSIDCHNAKSIGAIAFFNCSNLSSINCPNATSIGNQAFSGCSNLSSIDCHNAKSIGAYAFNSCSNLSSISIINKTKNQVSAMSYCPWSAKSGCIISCSDGNLVVTTSGSPGKVSAVV